MHWLKPRSGVRMALSFEVAVVCNDAPNDVGLECTRSQWTTTFFITSPVFSCSYSMVTLMSGKIWWGVFLRPFFSRENLSLSKTWNGPYHRWYKCIIWKNTLLHTFLADLMRFLLSLVFFAFVAYLLALYGMLWKYLLWIRYIRNGNILMTLLIWILIEIRCSISFGTCSQPSTSYEGCPKIM